MKTTERAYFLRKPYQNRTKARFLPRYTAKRKTLKLLIYKRFRVVRQKGFEPPTFWFVAKHSIRLSYWRVC